MSLPFLLRQVRYDLRGSLLFVPALVMVAHVTAGLAAPTLEAMLVARFPLAAAAAEVVSVEPATAQLVLSTVASAIMTVVSVVYSVLLVALSLASMQFSTRILGSFLRDGPNRAVLGLFAGTFTYELLVLRAVRTTPPEVPALSVALGLLLAVNCLVALAWFIHRIANGIQANVLVDHLAGEAEAVIREVFPERGGGSLPEEPAPAPTSEVPVLVPARASGYVQLVNVDALRALAARRRVVLVPAMGAFVAEGAPLFRVSAAWTHDEERAAHDAVDLGASRTLQDDAEFGLRQIVDIGLKALSPAVNDPSTAATCLDHLGRLLILAARRDAPRRRFDAPEGGELVVPSTSLLAMVDLAFDQLRQYGQGDMATTLRLLRVLVDLTPHVRDPKVRARILAHGRMAHARATANFDAEDREELERRWATLQGVIALWA